MCAFCVRVPGAAGRVALRGDSEGMASKLRELLGAGGGGGAGGDRPDPYGGVEWWQVRDGGRCGVGALRGG